MSNKRKQYSPQFKAQVALATLRGDQTIAKLADQYGLHPTVINRWKQQLSQESVDLFNGKAKAQNDQ